MLLLKHREINSRSFVETLPINPLAIINANRWYKPFRRTAIIDSIWIVDFHDHFTVSHRCWWVEKLDRSFVHGLLPIRKRNSEWMYAVVLNCDVCTIWHFRLGYRFSSWLLCYSPCGISIVLRLALHNALGLSTAQFVFTFTNRLGYCSNDTVLSRV